MLHVTPDLQDIIDQQPGNRRRFVRQNWLALAMFAAWVVGLFANGGGWLATRTDKEATIEREQAALQQEVKDLRDSTVRRDVFDQVLRRIDEHLASIDAKTDRK